MESAPQIRPQALQQTRLRLAQAPSWDRWKWLWSVRDSGIIADLKPAETKVLFLMLSCADIEGIAAPGLDWLAAASGYVGAGNKAVREARRSLVERGLLIEVERPPGSASRAKHFRISLPAAAGPGEDASSGAPSPVGSNPARPCPRHERAPGTAVPGYPARGCRVRGTPVPVKRDLKRVNQAAGKIERPAQSPAPLFVAPPRDAAAAAVLIRRVGLPPKTAHGLVTLYRPTAEQVRNVIANAAARNRAHSRGQASDPVRSLAAFVRAAIRRGDYALDDRVVELRRQGKRRALEAQRRREAARMARQEREAREREAQEAEAIWQRLTGEQREDLRRVIVGRMPTLHRMGVGNPMMRALIVAEAKKQEATHEPNR